jgi:hypothetical protein
MVGSLKMWVKIKPWTLKVIFFHRKKNKIQKIWDFEGRTCTLYAEEGDASM